MARTVLNVPDISCEHCEHAITTALGPVEGVSDVSVDIDQKRVTVVYDETVVGVDRFKAVLQDEEYPVESVVT